LEEISWVLTALAEVSFLKTAQNLDVQQISEGFSLVLMALGG
jgi:hypothetical protein